MHGDRLPSRWLHKWPVCPVRVSTLKPDCRCLRPVRVIVHFAQNDTQSPVSPSVFSVDLHLKHAPEDLMKKFVDTLLQLPNLRRLELLRVSHTYSITAALEHKRARFPNIREMVVEHICPGFVRSCPNLESLTFRRDFNESALATLDLYYYAGLKRVTGLDPFPYPHLSCKFMHVTFGTI